MNNSKIEWTDITVNPIYIRKADGSNGGHWCSKKSEGCAFCYSEEINQSGFFAFASHLPYTGSPPEGLFFDESIVQKWAKMRSPKKIFVCSMTDLFGEWVPREWQFKVFDAAANAPKQTIQLVTKRPEIAKDAVIEWCALRCVEQLPENIWMGVTVENQRCADDRIPLLLQTPAAVRFLSCEPLLEAIRLNLRDYIPGLGFDLTRHQEKHPDARRVNWCIVGGESGHNARPCDTNWIYSIVQQCKQADVPVFVKQLGSNPVYGGDNLRSELGITTGKGGNIDEFPEDLRVREFPQFN